MYNESIQCNQQAIVADDKYVSLSGQRNNFYLYYRMHNLHFLICGSVGINRLFTKLMQL
jgi:hypothetical protein